MDAMAMDISRDVVACVHQITVSMLALIHLAIIAEYMVTVIAADA